MVLLEVKSSTMLIKNMNANNYKIYTLSVPESEEIRYVGMTCQSVHKRLNHHINVMYPSHKTNWIKSLRLNGSFPVVNVIDEGLTHDEAAYMEQQYIKLYKAAGAKLTNMTKGGTGTPGHKVTDEAKHKLKQLWTGYKHTDEAKKKMSDHQKVHGNPFLGKTHSEETRNKMSIATTGKNLGDSNPSKRDDVKAKISAFHKGKVLSDDTKKKIALSRYVPIIQCDLLGNPIKTWASAIEMTKATGIPSDNISKACKGRVKTVYGFIWKYAEKEN